MKIKKDELSNCLKSSYDLFICSSSFDNRCLSIPNSIASKQISEIRICHFENNYDCANQNRDKILNIFEENDVNIETLIFKKNNPLENYDLIRSSITSMNLSASANILIDITTFTRENLLILLRFLNLFLKKTISITLCYSPSSIYPTWLSKGVNKIRSIFGYSGDFSPLKKDLLVVLSGFEYERSQNLIDNYEPAKLFLGKASSENSISSELANINETNFRKLMNRNLQAVEFEFSCIDIEKTKDMVFAIAKEYEADYNLIIAPMNNKISTLGVAFAALENSNIQVCYASTNQYNIDEKHGESDYYYCIELSDYLKS